MNPMLGIAIGMFIAALVFVIIAWLATREDKNGKQNKA
jgi:phosphotransferase system  glucose/maltose/N-acetylglucosamine-specific IIC component